MLDLFAFLGCSSVLGHAPRGCDLNSTFIHRDGGLMQQSPITPASVDGIGPQHYKRSQTHVLLAIL
jgi:hypothetical protein